MFLGPKNKPGPTEGQAIRGSRGYAEHMHEFQTAIRTGSATKANAQTAHYSCALVHLGEIAYRTDGRLDFDPQKEQFINNDKANALLTKEYRAPYVLGNVGFYETIRSGRPATVGGLGVSGCL